MSIVSKIFNDGKGIIPTPCKGIYLTLFFTVFTTITGVGIVVPLLPIYAHDLGAAGMYVGMIFGAFSMSRIFLLPVFGRLSDQKGRKPFIVAGLLAYSLISAAFIFSNSIESLIFIRFIQGAASAMIMPVVQAYVGEITSEGSEGYSMGLFSLSMCISLSIGPLIGGSIKDLWSMNAAFCLMGAFSTIGLLLSILFLPATADEKIESKKNGVVPWLFILKDRGLFCLVVFRYAYTACIGIIWCFLPLYADLRFSSTGASTGFLVMLGVFVSGMLNLPMGYVADRFNKTVLIVLGGTFSTIGMMMMAWADSYFGLVAAVSVFGLGGGVAMPSIMGLAVIKGEQKKAMASVMSVMTVAHSLGMFTGSMTAGFIMDFLSLRFSFPCGMVLMALGTVTYLICHERPYTLAKETD
ncbi:MAG: MFS transporter [Desulfobacteraceae bacterium]|nr:MFS transporter [Desulfobacteraceae bacterium]